MIIPFKTFHQTIHHILYDEDTIMLNGTFKEVPSGRIIKGDIFEAHKLGKLSIKEIYKMYLLWFNHTKTSNEEERIFIDVKISEATTK